MAGGRPTTYCDEIVDVILERISSGESLNKITQDDNMPCNSTVYLWLSKHPEFSDKYARARECQQEAMADDILAICDTEEDVNRARLKVDTRKWLMARLAPKKYGESKNLNVEAKVTMTPEEWLDHLE